jgi:hypothetical protein
MRNHPHQSEVVKRFWIVENFHKLHEAPVFIQDPKYMWALFVVFSRCLRFVFSIWWRKITIFWNVLARLFNGGHFALFFPLIVIDHLLNRDFFGWFLFLLFLLSFFEISSKIAQKDSHKKPCKHQVNKESNRGKEKYGPVAACMEIVVHGFSPSLIFKQKHCWNDGFVGWLKVSDIWCSMNDIDRFLSVEAYPVREKHFSDKGENQYNAG